MTHLFSPCMALAINLSLIQTDLQVCFDLAKMDAGKLTLRPEPVRLDQLTDEVFSTFRMAANSKGIALMLFIHPIIHATNIY